MLTFLKNNFDKAKESLDFIRGALAGSDSTLLSDADRAEHLYTHCAEYNPAEGGRYSVKAEGDDIGVILRTLSASALTYVTLLYGFDAEDEISDSSALLLSEKKPGNAVVVDKDTFNQLVFMMEAVHTTGKRANNNCAVLCPDALDLRKSSYIDGDAVYIPTDTASFRSAVILMSILTAQLMDELKNTTNN